MASVAALAISSSSDAAWPGYPASLSNCRPCSRICEKFGPVPEEDLGPEAHVVEPDAAVPPGFPFQFIVESPHY
jgi:hypothetical protein